MESIHAKSFKPAGQGASFGPPQSQRTRGEIASSLLRILDEASEEGATVPFVLSCFPVNGGARCYLLYAQIDSEVALRIREATDSSVTMTVSTDMSRMTACIGISDAEMDPDDQRLFEDAIKTRKDPINV
jgi:hypothetical protein